MKISTVICLMLALFSTTARAEFYSGSQIYSYLEKALRGTADYETGVGSGYVIGVFDSLSGVLVCSPGGVTVKQAKQIVFNYMQKHPELWDKSADISIIAALGEVWPCKKK
ncbi:MAG: Rap1a/Tai family immunity protein [Porticoccaceae bacterium]